MRVSIGVAVLLVMATVVPVSTVSPGSDVGIPWDRPVRRLSQYLDGLLPLLAGEEANASSDLVTTRAARTARCGWWRHCP